MASKTATQAVDSAQDPDPTILTIIHMAIVQLVTLSCMVLTGISLFAGYGCLSVIDSNAPQCISFRQAWNSLMIALPALGMLIGPKIINKILYSQSTPRVMQKKEN